MVCGGKEKMHEKVCFCDSLKCHIYTTLYRLDIKILLMTYPLELVRQYGFILCRTLYINFHSFTI